MVKAYQKILLDLRAVRLDAQRAGMHLIRRDTAMSFSAHIPGQFVHIILVRLVMKAIEILCAGKQDQFFPGPGSCHIVQLPVVLKPSVGLLRHLVSHRGGK